MTVQDAPAVGSIAGLAAASPREALRRRRAPKPARRLPVQKDWPTWALIVTQVGILVGGIAFWEIGARAGWIDAFFWSQPSAIASTMGIFFTTGDAWTDIGFTFRSTIFGFLLGTAAGSLLGLSFWWSRNYAAIVQPYIICLESMPKLALAPLIILVFGIGLASKVAIATALTLVVSTLDHLCGRQGARSRRREAVLLARRLAPAGVPQAGRAVLPAVDHLGAAGQYRPRAHRRDRRRVHRLPARPRPRHPLCRPDLRHRAGLGRGRWCSRRSPSSCTSPCRGSRACCARASRAERDRHGPTQIPGTDAAAGRRRRRPHRPARAARELLVAEPVHSTGYLPLYIAMAKGYFDDVRLA